MGLRPEGKTLDRWPDNDGDYKPSNCKWSTPLEQQENRRPVSCGSAKQEWFFAFDLTTGEWFEDNSQKGFAKKHKLSSQRISDCLHGKQKTHKNWTSIIGRLGEDPSVKYSQSGVAVVNLSIATNYNIKKDDEWTEAVEWVRCTVFGKKAEACAEYLSKGSQVYLEGRLSTQSWQDQEGVKRWSTSVIIRDVIFLDSKSQGQKSDRPPAPPKEENAGETGRGEDNSQASGYNASEEMGMGDDVPF
jgi:single-strand DNA-binding protein